MRTVPRLLLLSAAALSASPAFPAGASSAQRFAELRAILNHRGVVAAFAGAPPDRIEYVGFERYRLSAGDCRLEVAIVRLPVVRGRPGPQRFVVRPAARRCIR